MEYLPDVMSGMVSGSPAKRVAVIDKNAAIMIIFLMMLSEMVACLLEDAKIHLILDMTK